MERRDNVLVAGREQNDSVAAIYSLPLEILKFGCPKGSILGQYFPSWLKIVADMRESIDTELLNRVPFM